MILSGTREAAPAATRTPDERETIVYEIMVDDETTTADSLLGAVRELRDRLRITLTRDDRARWQVTDPAGVQYRGINYLNGLVDELEEFLDDSCDDLYVQLHKSADGYPESIKT